MGLFNLPPIWMAPMAGEASSATLVAAVSAGGGFGQLGAAYLAPARITEIAADIRARTDQPFGINLFCPQPWQPDDAGLDAYLARLAVWHAELGLPAPTRPAQFEEDFEAQLAATIAAKPAAISFVMGDPGAARVAALQDLGFTVLGTATQVSEGLALQASGVDAVIAQGYEGGGHRGGFLGTPEGALIGTMALVPQLVDALDIPVIAAGGIADARGVAAAQALGASAVTVGTAFLLVDECPLSPAYRAALLAARDADSTLTRAFSGRLARGVANRVTRELEGLVLPAFPQPNAASRPMRQAAAKAGQADFISLWAGQALPLSRKPGSAAELVAALTRGWTA
ncbi:nitronate monooxygenase [Roseateles asaccharophilus]|uniref:Propionate 3-nitronate monooxygenase n=1 Tax=Roseateles asaccharophilus TaxID=582607 RepID=A0ABU2A7V2_9BURK|nr:nitronate monooxygenase [Roseateles asaccharophilus]MDR7333095.1 nitronate monooxygenase [Roseateles asaccharophilus]